MFSSQLSYVNYILHIAGTCRSVLSILQELVRSTTFRSQGARRQKAKVTSNALAMDRTVCGYLNLHACKPMQHLYTRATSALSIRNISIINRPPGAQARGTPMVHRKTFTDTYTLTSNRYIQYGISHFLHMTVQLYEQYSCSILDNPSIFQ